MLVERRNGIWGVVQDLASCMYGGKVWMTNITLGGRGGGGGGGGKLAQFYLASCIYGGKGGIPSLP